MGYITRNLEKTVAEVTKEYPVLLLTGPRKAGKTTMLKNMMKGTDRNYVSLDDLNERNQASLDPEFFLQLHKPPVLIDEVLYAPELFEYIRKLSDEKHKAGDFWLTGSQVFPRIGEVQETLAGRVAVLSLTTLAQGEICGSPVEPFTVDMRTLSERGRNRTPADPDEICRRMITGSMPAVVSGEEKDRQRYYASYVTDLIERDVRALADSADPLKVLRFLTAAAKKCGQMLNISELTREAGITQKQAKDWLEVFETLGVIFYLQPYANERVKRLIRTPKLYFYDTGLVCYLCRLIIPEILEFSSMRDAVLENYAASEIMKTYLNNGREPSLYYYRNKDANEIKMVIEHEGGLSPIEISHEKDPGPEAIKAFDLLNRAAVTRARGALICMKPEFSMINTGNLVVPVWAI